MIAAQGMADEDRVAALGVEFAIGFIHQLVAGQLATAGERQGRSKRAVRGSTRPTERLSAGVFILLLQMPITRASAGPPCAM